MVRALASESSSPEFICSSHKILIIGEISHVNQRRCSQESGQQIENVHLTHLYPDRLSLQST